MPMTRAQRIADLQRQMSRAIAEGKIDVWRDLFEGLAILLKS